MTSSPSTSPLEWVIIGGGPIGVHLAVRLLATGSIPPSQIRIVDPGEALLQRWTTCTSRTGMRFLRSPAVHHLGLVPFELLQFAGRTKRDRRRKGLFTEPYQRPSLSLFHQHCESVMHTHGLSDLHICDRVERIRVGPDLVELELMNGALTTANVILALGNSEHPLWPEEATELKQAGGRVVHLFDEAVPFEPDELPDCVGILGGGISAAQLAVRLADAGKTVTVMARHEPREYQFDSDPGWIGPKLMKGFLATSDYGRRREMIQSARHRGSMPKDVLKELKCALSSGSVEWRVGALLDGEVMEHGGMRLDVEGGLDPLEVDALVLATGFAPQRPGGTLVDQLIEDHDLPVAECGYPLVDQKLSWHPRIFVTGGLAELELGPTARNITGGRRAAERILGTVSSQKRRGRATDCMPRLAAMASALMLSFTLLGCQSSETQDSGEGAYVEPVPPMGNLLIEEVYYSGAVPTAGIDRYYSDQFIELVNTADAPVMVGGLILGDAPGSSGAINPGNEPGGPYIADPDYVFLTTAWRIPGEPEDVLLQPGASIVIAQDASTHNPYSPVDLSEAHYETFVEEYGEDSESAGVPNLESVWYGSGYDWLVTVFGPTIVVLDIDAEDLEPAGGSAGPVKAPVSTIVDAMEALMDADSGDYKRLDESVDSGFIYVSGTYTGESVRRRRDDSGVLIDTNDSGADFEVLAMPEPATGSSD